MGKSYRRDVLCRCLSPAVVRISPPCASRTGRPDPAANAPRSWTKSSTGLRRWFEAVPEPETKPQEEEAGESWEVLREMAQEAISLRGRRGRSGPPGWSPTPPAC
ncbi:hypothetical protein E1B22_11620 [Thermaerobacter sp. FW80]|nr:hypothetical protein E1B22_11620 [Thermaerobacter sp. FW80]